MEDDGEDVLHLRRSTMAKAVPRGSLGRDFMRGRYVLSYGSPATRPIFMRETEDASFDDSPTADFDRFALSNVGKQSQLSGAVDLE
jgi:hypothetical protein